MTSTPYDRLLLDRCDRSHIAPNRWSVKSVAIAYRSPGWRFRSISGARRPLRINRPMPPSLSRIFTLLGASAPADDGEDEESDRLWLT